MFNCRKLDKFKSITDKLCGQKILIRGNHCDRGVYQKAGFQMEEMLVVSLLCLLSACVAYDMAVQDVAKLIHNGGYNVQK